MGSVSEINTIGSLSLGEDKEKPHGEESAWQERRGEETTEKLTAGRREREGEVKGETRMRRSKGRSLAHPPPSHQPPQRVLNTVASQ